jgi:PhnB protein
LFLTVEHIRHTIGRTPQEEKNMAVSAVPPGYRSITPYIIVDGAARAIAWYTQAFNGKELMRLPAPGDKIGHAEVELGDSRIMLADESPTHDARAPKAFGGSPVSLLLYVPDVDATVAKAQSTGATIKSPPEDKFYGDRMATLIDPFGHTWSVATHIEDVPEDEMKRRIAAMGITG